MCTRIVLASLDCFFDERPLSFFNTGERSPDIFVPLKNVMAIIQQFSRKCVHGVKGLVFDVAQM